MNQDGKLEQSPKAGASGGENRSEGGKILLTLCTSPEDASPFRHATIRFPSSYQEACTAAMNVFAAYIPPDVEAVSLRQVFRRTDGQYVWSIIPEHDWDVALERHGEEVGVFLPHIVPENVPYHKVQSPKKLVRFYFWDVKTRGRVEQLKAVDPSAMCKSFRQELCQRYGWKSCDMHYDERMMGSAANQQLYRDRVDTPSQRPNWQALHDPETFDLLLALHPQPMWIGIAPSGSFSQILVL